MKILVTGANGFVGKNMVAALCQHEVVCLDDDHLDNTQWKNLWSTLLKDNTLDAVFHIGACSDTLEQNVNFMMQRNYETTKFLVDWCVENNIPMIYSSSAANYGANNDHPSNLYGWSKYVAEDYVVSNSGIALRYFNVYGPGEERKGRMASVAYQMCTRDQSNLECKLFPDSPRRDFVYVKDVVSANIHAYENYEALQGKYYDVGSGQARAFEEVLDLLEIKYSYHSSDAIPEGYQFFTRSNKERWLPGWEPRYQLEEGISDYRKVLETR